MAEEPLQKANSDKSLPSTKQPQKSTILEALQKQVPTNEISESRVNVIVAVAQIEASLTDSVTSSLTPSLDEKEDDLLDDSRPLGSFMLKAKLALRLSLISPGLYKMLSTLSWIRNRCAHEQKHFDVFNDERIRDKINYAYGQLNPDFLATKQAVDTKKKFEAVCNLINAHFVVFHPVNSQNVVFREIESIFRKPN